MIARVSRSPGCFWFIAGDQQTGIFFWLIVNIGTKKFRSQAHDFPHDGWEQAIIAEIIDHSEKCPALTKKLDAAKAALTNMPTSLGLMSSTEFHRRQQLEDSIQLLSGECARAYKSRNDLAAAIAQNPRFVSFVAANPVLLKADPEDEKYYTFKAGTVWSCNLQLAPDQWNVLIERHIEREESVLAAALAGTSDGVGDRRISSEVRRAVWTRDKGQCARCGSRVALEFDHIVPVSRGGSNTERNIELLCEVCNRTKTDSII